jgi:hypothetical protein
MNLRDNPYPGINAHLMSFLQTPASPDQPGKWSAFHNRHLSHIADFLNEQLPPQYIAHTEQSLQTQEVSIVGQITTETSRPDVVIFRSQPAVPPMESSPLDTPTWEATLVEVVDPVDEPVAIVIREVLDQQDFGRVVTRIELLSPSNKPGHSNYPSYRAKRSHALETKVPLIEIDYLHESPSVVRDVPVYPKYEHSYPYTILVSDPRPDWYVGKMRAYSFHVGEAVKHFRIPLAGEDRILFDLYPVFDHTFRSGRWNTYLDYTTVPARFDTYSADDQARILAIMAQINSRTE